MIFRKPIAEISASQSNLRIYNQGFVSYDWILISIFVTIFWQKQMFEVDLYDIYSEEFLVPQLYLKRTTSSVFPCQFYKVFWYLFYKTPPKDFFICLWEYGREITSFVLNLLKVK